MTLFLLGMALGILMGLLMRKPMAQYLAPMVSLEHRCSVCGEPANPVRRHDGLYRCQAHKQTP